MSRCANKLHLKYKHQCSTLTISGVFCRVLTKSASSLASVRGNPSIVAASGLGNNVANAIRAVLLKERTITDIFQLVLYNIPPT